MNVSGEDETNCFPDSYSYFPNSAMNSLAQQVRVVSINTSHFDYAPVTALLRWRLGLEGHIGRWDIDVRLYGGALPLLQRHLRLLRFELL